MDINDNPVHIKGNLYSIPEGIRLAKTLYGDDYDKLPEGLKHDFMKKDWDKYEGIDQNLYYMTLSRDEETINLALQILKSKGIKFKYTEGHRYINDEYIKVVSKIHVFPNHKNKHYSLDSNELWNN